jgi:hypothetical protein
MPKRRLIRNRRRVEQAMMKYLLVVLCSCFCLDDIAQAAKPATTSKPVGARFLTRRGDKLFDGDREFRFISFNIPNLMVIEDAYEFTKPNPWRWPDEFEIEDALESVRQMGGQVVRTYVLSVYREGSDMGDLVHVRRPGEFNEEGFRALDKVVEIGRRKGIRVMIPFVDQAKWWGGIGEYAAFRGKPAEAFWSDPQIIEDFKATVRHLITRRNTFTGVAYRDEPAIFGWETGNEIEPTPAWTRDIAAYIKSLDSNHLVIDGKSLKEVPVTSLGDPNIDVITTHHYPWGNDHDFTRPIRAAHALTKGKKPYVVGEFGFVELPHIKAAIDAVVADGIPGALLWSLRMHRREGGFYWHMEVGTGKNIYKAFHWPGFVSGERYDEQAVLQHMREKAFEIQGIEPPAIEYPAAPRLLPIERVSAISWQGSAGAGEYDVYRADDADGPWQKIVSSVSDAEVQYRPLYNDDDAVPGQQYWYRVVARNMAGESDPSNIVGPVAVKCRTLVDECRDLSKVTVSGDVSIATENTRTVQEDCHRFALGPGAAVIYKVDAPISQWRVDTFSTDAHPKLELFVSSDGQKYQPIESGANAYQSGQTVYGYLTPVRFIGTAAGMNATHLRIARAEESEATPKPNGEASLQISRVEIEYGAAQDNSTGTRKLDSAIPAPLSPAIFVYGQRGLEQILANIDIAASRGDRRVNVVVTVLADLTKELRIKTFGRFRGQPPEFVPYDEAARNELKTTLRQVFAHMLEHNMDIFILPHIDAGGEVRQWRNWVDFDPLEKYGGYSYRAAVIDPILEALEESNASDAHIEIALSGEMGTSLFRYPESYRSLAKMIRRRPAITNAKVGISLNHNGLAGNGNPTGAKNIELSDDQRKHTQLLIDESDFVGMSFYRPVSASPTVDDFVRGIEHFMGEFQAYGLSVSTDKPLHFSEVGIGGGRLADGKGDPAKAVETPWEGTANPRRNPWQGDEMTRLRREYHAVLLEFLTNQPAPWRVSAAFLWSMGSWDPQGFQDPQFADAEIVAAIEHHNRTADRD